MGNQRGAAATAEVETGDWAFHLPGDGGGERSRLVRRALQVAVLAPSTHNTQPWLFRAADGHVDLFADRSRRLGAVDPEDRELAISCGAVLHHLVLALHRLGVGAQATLLPDPGDRDHLARVELGGPVTPTADERALFDQVTRRHTNRKRFSRRRVPAALLAALARDAEREGCWLEVARPDQRPELEQLLAEGIDHQAGDEAFQRELASWVDRSRARSLDGMVPGVYGAPPQDGPAGPDQLRYWRTFEDVSGPSAPAALLERAPVVVVVGTAGDGPGDWLRCGVALSAVLLRARRAGVWASFLNQPIEVPHLRARLAQALDAPGPPQLLLRMGYGPDPGPTPRRPVDAVLLAG